MKSIKIMDVWFNSFFGEACKMKINNLPEIQSELLEKEVFVINDDDMQRINLKYPPPLLREIQDILRNERNT